VARETRIKINPWIDDRESFTAVFTFPKYFLVLLDSTYRRRPQILPIDDFMITASECIVPAGDTIDGLEVLIRNARVFDDHCLISINIHAMTCVLEEFEVFGRKQDERCGARRKKRKYVGKTKINGKRSTF
nr:hypothetical protein [Candidatus Sigynarchaeum springense]